MMMQFIHSESPVTFIYDIIPVPVPDRYGTGTKYVQELGRAGKVVLCTSRSVWMAGSRS